MVKTWLKFIMAGYFYGVHAVSGKACSLASRAMYPSLSFRPSTPRKRLSVMVEEAYAGV
jgi:hypothetical protein